MVIKELLLKGSGLLKQNPNSNPSLESQVILAKLMNVDKSFLFAHIESEVEEELEDRYLSFIEKRKNGYPLQYLLGEVEFFGYKFKVREGVLIPRADTEILVSYVINYINKNNLDNYRLLEIGVGSGAIILSIAKNCPNGKLIGIDISEEALIIAKENQDNLSISNVTMFKSDLFEIFLNKPNKEEFDIIVSNPPYIDEEEMKKLQKEVLYEPQIALSGGVDGLMYYKRISLSARDFLKSGGMLAFEIGLTQGASVRDILYDFGYRDISIIKDLEQRDRVVVAYKD
ncbi:peptide chain release factor N(5)-glutamine methyltransferase [Soehngenia longivitae]|uniref:Release factor glutamine methyltransferase n=1 Tax=Soehngenia longivitae TaxID=2562294 RepID=A0A4Z0D9G4_9FIRM|nr:peptide chain release factor N(5)-glutamine methyltransferase [Soehngenia longivitae]TFZ41495.1 peptide chain release factor N(5)-glutamine methyltransferase [Soehngenia longivitae]